MEFQFAAVAAALILEAAFGYPAILLRLIGHPAMWIGAAIDWLDRAFNRDTMPETARRLNGGIALAIVVTLAAAPALAVQTGLMVWLPGPAAAGAAGFLASSLIAQRSLFVHVRNVAAALETDTDKGMAAARAAVAHIVGRDPESLDEAGIARAAIESLAENFSDGVVAPAFWGAALGLPGFAAYKAINTGDSMIGHRTARHRAFGWAAARADDLVNLPCARLAAHWIVLAAVLTPGARAGAALGAAYRDASRHRSPNAGWPEAAMAGALGLRLAGPRTYGGETVADSWIGDGRADAGAADIRRALSLYRVGCGLQIGAVVALAAVIASWR